MLDVVDDETRRGRVDLERVRGKEDVPVDKDVPLLEQAHEAVARDALVLGAEHEQASEEAEEREEREYDEVVADDLVVPELCDAGQSAEHNALRWRLLLHERRAAVGLEGDVQESATRTP